MPRLQDLITDEQLQRTVSDEESFHRIEKEVRECVETIEQERKNREENEETLLEMVKEMTSKIR